MNSIVADLAWIMDAETIEDKTLSPANGSDEVSVQIEPWPFRNQLLFRSRDQTAIAVMLAISFFGVVLFFSYKAIVERGIVDIDRASPKSAEYLVDINSADWPEIANLPGIGPKLANAIVDFRIEHGNYATHDQLVEVSGIGPAKLENLRKHLAPIGTINAE